MKSEIFFDVLKIQESLKGIFLYLEFIGVVKSFFVGVEMINSKVGNEFFYFCDDF